MAFSNFKKWAAYTKSFKLATDIFCLTISFPKEEKYSLTDQVRRSSRSVCANLAEAFWKRRYPKHFVSKLTDCAGENAETQVWLDFALQSNYITEVSHKALTGQAEEVGRLLTWMMNNPSQFELKK